MVVTPNRRLLLLRRQGERKTIRVAEGEALDGWTVVQVARDVVLLESGGRQEKIIVRDKATGKNRP